MNYKRLGKAIAIVLAAALVMQTTVAYAAENDCIIEELLVDDDFLVIEDVDDSEDIEDITENGEDEVPYEESDAEDFSDDSMPDDGLNIEFDEEENSDFELNEAEEEFWDEDSNEDEFEEIAVESEEENAEDTVIEVDVSGNDAIDGNMGRNNVKVLPYSPIQFVEIYCGLENTSSNISNYRIKYNKDGTLKSAALTLGTSCESMELKAEQTRNDGMKSENPPRWEAENNGIVSVSGSGLNATIKAVAKWKAKIVCYAGDGSGKKKEITIEVRQAVKELEIEGQDYLAKGAKATFMAVAYPNNANNKNVTWALDKKYKGVSINDSKGEIKVAKDVELGTKITLVAKANDFGGAVAKKTIIVKEKATSITLNASETTTISTKAIGDLKTKVSMEASTDNKETVAWKLSDYKIASISVQDNKATVTALAPGDVKVTAYANDGSGKKVEKKIKIIQPVTNIEIIGGAYAPIGGKNRYKTVITPSNASKKDIVWTLEKKIDGVKINPGNGELKIDKNVGAGQKVKIRATARDTNAVYDEKEIVIKEKVNNINISALGSTTLATQATGKFKTGIELEATTDNNEVVRWQLSNPEMVNVSISQNRITVKAVSTGKVTIKAIADDGSNKSAKVDIEIIQPVTDIEIIGGEYIAIDVKKKYVAEIYPANANDKSVVWTLDKKINGVTIDPGNGELKIGKNAVPGQKVKIRATAKDTNAVYAEKQVVIKEKVKQVTITPMGSTTLGTQAIGDLKSSINLEASTDNNEIVRWEVRGADKAKITVDGNKAKLTALAEGKIKVIANADDGTNNKAEIEITIIVPASSLELTVPADRIDDKLASGGKLKFAPSFGDKYGDPSVKNVKWSYEIIGFSDKQATKEKEIPKDILQLIAKEKAFFSFNKGEVKAVESEKYDDQRVIIGYKDGCQEHGIRITATTTDGTNLSVTKTIRRADPTTKIWLSGEHITEIELDEGYWTPRGYLLMRNTAKLNGVNIKSSNPKVVAAAIGNDEMLRFLAYKKGTATITVTLRDGSNAKLNIKVKVN